MTGKVTLEVTRGALAGKKFEYDKKARVFIGRQEDCAIVMPESTVTRYHCMLEITPAEVRLQDVGSRNGTFINGEKIGQRELEKSWEEAKDEPHESFLLHDGDVVALGSRCELICHNERMESCAECGAGLPEGTNGLETVTDGDVRQPMFFNDLGQRVCESCYLAAQKEKAAAPTPAEKPAGPEKPAEKPAEPEKPVEKPAEPEKPARPAGPQEKTCTACGKHFVPKAADNDLCGECLKDRGKVIDAVMRDMMLRGIGKPPAQEAQGAALLQGFDKIASLGQGGMGEVWRVRDRETGKDYALKTLLPVAAADDRAKLLFLREASIGEFMHHENVIRSYKTGCVDDTFYILMDLCEGGSVDKLMERRGGRLSLEQATWIILQALSGLDYMHNADIQVEIEQNGFKGTVDAHGVVHRDFKPGNIFLSDRSALPIVKVADLGMSKAFDTAGMSKVTKSGTVSGTPVFMPRKQAQEFLEAKPEVDVWAAAASYYNMLTGDLVKRFRPGKNPWPVILGEDAVPIRERDPDIPKKLAAVIDRALIEEPEIPYQSARELRQDIVAALPDEIREAVKEVL